MWGLKCRVRYSENCHPFLNSSAEQDQTFPLSQNYRLHGEIGLAVMESSTLTYAENVKLFLRQMKVEMKGQLSALHSLKFKRSRHLVVFS